MSAGFVTGYANGDFRPEAKVTRAEFVTMIVRALDLPVDLGTSSSFKDQNRLGTWAAPSVVAALEAGLINGYADGTFRPSTVMTRAELTATIARAAKLPIDPAAKLSFADANDIPKWAVPYIAAAQKAGLASGTGNSRFAPNQQATRAEAVSMILAMVNNG
ncbi:S-layer homology domain-containing protein [Saccharibacillus sp. JS10]|nr:S-layer homology domain-containing protein [Saccharibacillus sp. JS10]